MKALIVLAHPEPGSYNHALADAARNELSSGHDEVRLADLYAQGFQPDEHPRHYVLRADARRFNAQSEQRFSADRKILPTDVARAIDDILWSDVVLLQFPLWWFGMPAILKGWMDRVFAYGALYTGGSRHDTGFCSGRRAVLSVTAGSSSDACAPDGPEGDTNLILWPINYALRYLGFSVVEPKIITGVREGHAGEDADAQRAYLSSRLAEHRAWVASIQDARLVPFNGAGDWDDRGKLRPGAPVYSPFIRHRLQSALD